MSTIAATPVSFGSPRPVAPRPVTQRQVTPRQVQPRLRITQRGRVVLGALIALPLALVFVGSNLAGAPAQAGSQPSAADFDYVTVMAGESLWDLAGWIAPEADPREVVADIVALNQLPSADVQPGLRLAVPAQYAQ